MSMFWFRNISPGSKLFLILLLIATSESLVCFIRNDSKLVDLLFFRSLIIVIYSLSALVNADTESSANSRTSCENSAYRSLHLISGGDA